MAETPSRDSDCPDPLHEHPLPSGYVAAANEADRRLYRGWKNLKCRRCGLYGWAPGRPLADESPAAAPAARQADDPTIEE